MATYKRLDQSGLLYFTQELAEKLSTISQDVTISAASWSSSGQYTIPDSTLTFGVGNSTVIALTVPSGVTKANYLILVKAGIRIVSYSSSGLLLECVGTVPETAVTIQLLASRWEAKS